MDSNKLIQSLVGFVKDVKPYHTKLREFTSELFFTDDLNAAVIDQTPELRLGLQNIWTRIDDERLGRLSEGSAADRIINIPPVVLPRFSLNTFLQYRQSPPGNDPASPDMTNTGTDGKPDAEVPYSLPADPDSLNHLSQSHQIGVADEIPLPLTVTNIGWTVGSASQTGGVMTYSASGTATIDPTEATAYGVSTSAPKVRVVFKVGPSISVTGSISGTTLSFNVSGSFAVASFPLPTGAPSYSDSKRTLIVLKQASVRALLDTATGRYKVPFHHGSYVEVNNTAQTILTDYTVDRRRSAIQFLAGKHPTTGQKLAFNLFSSDRLFVSFASPFAFGITRAYDSDHYDMMPYDTSTDSVTAESDFFTIVINNSVPSRHNAITFTEIVNGTSKCKLENVQILSGAQNGEVWKISAVSGYVVSVARISPAPSTPKLAYLNQPFNNGAISFTLTPPWVDYYFDLQTGSYLSIIDIPSNDYTNLNWLYDPADFYPNNQVKTEAGVPVDLAPPRHAPVHYNKIGYVKQRLDGSYYLELSIVPERGLYIEVRIEQNTQYNPRANTGMDEQLSIIVFSTSASGNWNGTGAQSVTTIITP